MRRSSPKPGIVTGPDTDRVAARRIRVRGRRAFARVLLTDHRRISLRARAPRCRR